MKIVKLCLWFLIASCYAQTSVAQQGIYNMISKEHFEGIKSHKLTSAILKGDKSVSGRESTYFTINKEVLDEIQTNRPDLLTIEIETDFRAAPFVLLLKRVNTLTSDFICKTSSGKVRTLADIESGVQYFGVIKGQESVSIASFSFFKNETIAMISNQQEGNFTLGKLKGQDTYVIYQEATAPGSTTAKGFSCTEKESGLPPALKSTNEQQGSKCVRVYVEVNSDLYRALGSGTLNYTIGLFSISSALYFNENIDLVLSEIFLWEQGGYTGPNYVASFQGSLGGIFNGDIGHLLILTNGQPGGEAAGYGTVCLNKTDAVCYSQVNTTYNQLPAYSGSVQIITHEMGHLLGSRHTHDCVWNGNNTAIDNCSSTSCYSGPPMSANSGTIMSYCQNNVGVSFSNGFGPQPGNLIRNFVNTASCLTGCCVYTWNVYQENLVSSIIQPELHAALKMITARNTVAHNNGNVIYRAGELVALNIGFKTNISGSAVFIAEIGSCDSIPVSTNQSTMKESTAIGEVQHLENGIELFPNPTTTDITIRSKKTLSNVQIYNVSGKLVLEQNMLNTHDITIRLNTLSSGIYYLKALSVNGIVSTFKIGKL